MNSKKLYTIGIHVGHDATACLLDYNGKIVAAIAEERLTRVKYHMGFPFQAIEKVIQIANIEKRTDTPQTPEPRESNDCCNGRSMDTV